jgi:hypothetical protein
MSWRSRPRVPARASAWLFRRCFRGLRVRSSTTLRARTGSSRLAGAAAFPIASLRNRHRCPCPQCPLAPTTLAHRQPFLAIEPVQLLPVQHDTLPAQKQMQAPITEPPAFRSQFLQPMPQGIVIRSLGGIAIGLRLQAHQPAGPPLRIHDQ